MDGTVTWARRDDGRPALAGTGAATGVTDVTGVEITLDLAGEEETAVGIVTGLAVGLMAGLAAEIGGSLAGAFGAGLLATLAKGAGTGL